MVHVAHRHRGRRRFNDYTIEVVQQIGSDSFTAGPRRPDRQDEEHTSGDTAASFNCFVWYIDANPQDINQVDFVQRRRHAGQGDARRRAPAQRRLVQRRPELGLQYEYTADGNKLHFYIIDKRKDAQGVLHYTVGIRSLDGAGPQTRGVQLGDADAGRRRGLHHLHVPAEEHGRGGGDAERASAGRVGVPQQRHLPPVGDDLRAPGWEAHLKNALATAKFGETVQVPVYIDKDAGAARRARSR